MPRDIYTRKIKDITEQKFGRLTAVRFIKRENKCTYWLFKCDCGNEKIITKSLVLSGNTKSCKCLHKEILEKYNKTHGLTHTRFYIIWLNIKQRCSNKKNPGYKYYGGRGIKCLWISFQEFKNDMYQSYVEHSKNFGEKETTIERKNNDGNYCKENCRWATPKEQTRNKRSNDLITFLGKTQTLIEWAEELNINRATLWDRLYDASWSVEKAFTTPAIQGSNQFSSHVLDRINKV